MTQEKEDHDRVSLLLPGKQMDLASSVASVSKNPIILVLTGGGPLDVTFAESNPWISSILWIGYPGEAGGKAPAEVVFGDFNPGGRLPMTWYPESFTRAPMSDMNMRADPSRGYPGRTYRFYNRDRIYGFEHSTRASLTNEVEYCESLRFLVQMSVMNAGDEGGAHVVMLFSRAPRSTGGFPKKQLIGFDRVHTVPFQHFQTSIIVDPCNHLCVADESGKKVLLIGENVLILGDLEHSVSIET
ncbi:hypothetical protein CDL15_Pgr013388 [Punica granatum]|uniref:Fibronectin type III-like domain-containing protein n=1 Tax=Punica granatum TaxID=22663 RepID=A0A218W1M5_PUNGR|nr:hypothetical protein CDL15_Pgr013388 [Punica granatum]